MVFSLTLVMNSLNTVVTLVCLAACLGAYLEV